MKTDPIIAYYDGLCPICVHEMKIYERRGDGRVTLDDVNTDIPDDIDRDAALAALTKPAPIRIPLDALYRFLAPYRPRRKCADGACAL